MLHKGSILICKRNSNAEFKIRKFTNSTTTNSNSAVPSKSTNKGANNDNRAMDRASETDAKWSRERIPNLSGKNAVVTGGTSGIGLQISLQLAKSGASVTLLGRDKGRGLDALERIREIVPEAVIAVEQMNLSSLKSVNDFARSFNERNIPLDILVNNAGVPAPRDRLETEDRFELVFGTNHLGHFALTGALLPALKRAEKGARVVNVASRFARWGSIDFQDLQSERKRYPGFLLYANSKLANLLFTAELQKRSEKNSWGITAVAVHPGLVKTGMTTIKEGESFVHLLYFATIVKAFGQSSEDGANSSLMAATCDGIQPGGYYGPTGLFGMYGEVKRLRPPAKMEDEELGKKLWSVSEELTGLRF